MGGARTDCRMPDPQSALLPDREQISINMERNKENDSSVKIKALSDNDRERNICWGCGRSLLLPCGEAVRRPSCMTPWRRQRKAQGISDKEVLGHERRFQAV